MKKKDIKNLKFEKNTIVKLNTIKGGGDDPWISLASRSAMKCCGSFMC